MSDVEQDEDSTHDGDYSNSGETLLSDQEIAAVGGLLPHPNISDRVQVGVNLYLRQLNPETTVEDLISVLGQFGKVTHLKLIGDHNGKSRGIAFAHFESEQATVTAWSRLHSQVLARRKIEAEVVRTDHGITLHISNLDKKIGDKKLRRFFEEFGRISEAKVIPNDVRKVGIVHYADPNDAVEAMAATHGVQLNSTTIAVDVAALTRPARPTVVPTLIPTPMGLIPGPWMTLPSVPAPNAPSLYKYFKNQRATKLSNFKKFTREADEDEDYVPEPLTSDMLKGKSWQRQKLMFGERLYPLVEKWQRRYAKSIVGLLIVKSNEELWKMLRDEDYLKNEVDEAYLIFRRIFIYRTDLQE